jgi:hypothetical protein
MRPEDIRAYAGRPWKKAEESKVAWWRRQKEQLGPEEALSVVEELRRAALTNWPKAFTQEARREDLEDHAQLAKRFQQIARALNRKGAYRDLSPDERARHAVVPVRRAVGGRVGPGKNDRGRGRHR